jgi:hypothetical protein
LNYGSGAYIITTINYIPSVCGTPNSTNSGSNIVITWTAPTTVAPILNYTVMIGTFYGTWATTTYCNGANATVMSSLSCTIP